MHCYLLVSNRLWYQDRYFNAHHVCGKKQGLLRNSAAGSLWYISFIEIYAKAVINLCCCSHHFTKEGLQLILLQCCIIQEIIWSSNKNYDLFSQRDAQDNVSCCDFFGVCGHTRCSVNSLHSRDECSYQVLTYTKKVFL